MSGSTYNKRMTNTDRFHLNATWNLEFVFLPKVCENTGAILWMELAYHGTRKAYSLVDNKTHTEHKWLHRSQVKSTKVTTRLA